MLFVSEERCIFLVMFLVPTVIYLCGLRRHWRVDDHRNDGNTFLLFQLADHVQDLLRPSDGKCRYQYRPVSFSRLVYDARHLSLRVDVAVEPIAVRRFAHQIVAIWRRRGIVEDRLIVMAEIARE